MRQLYLAATGQNRGKTTASLGLFDGFQQAGLRTAFMKPVGQRTVIDHGQPADEDAVLMHEVFDLVADYGAMSPVHIQRIHEEVHRRRGRRGPRGDDRRRPRHLPGR